MKTHPLSRLVRLLLPALLLATTALPSLAHESHGMPEGHGMSEASAMGASLKRSVVELNISGGVLVRQDGTAVNLRKLLDNGKPTILAFIYTSCTAVCPMTSHILADTQEMLGADVDKVQILSVSIDPEFDTPAVLLEYSKSVGAGPSWQHYSGSLRNIVAVQKAFGAYRGDKMNHESLMFLSGGSGKKWVRYEGFPSAGQLVKEIHDQGKL